MNTAAYATEHLCVYIKLLLNPSKQHTPQRFPLATKAITCPVTAYESIGFYPF